MANKITHAQFMQSLKEKQPALYESIEILSEYKTCKDYILVKDKYGVCKQKSSNLLNGKHPSIVSALDKNEYFIGMIKYHNPDFLDNITGIGQYKHMLTNLDIYTKYGLCSMQPTSILSGANPSLKSAVDKIEYMKNILKEKHPRLYDEILDYGEYTSYNEHIQVRNKYGWCNTKVSNLLYGKSPSIVSAVDKNEYFKNRAIEVHGDKFDYSKVEYTSKADKVLIICPNHGEFYQNPDNHLYGYGCEMCSRENGIGGYNKVTAQRNREEWSKIKCNVYVVNCSDKTENFYKIGITQHDKVIKRFKNGFPYDVSIIFSIKTNLYDAIHIEDELHEYFKDKKYKPAKFFGGWTECFSDIDMNYINSNYSVSLE